MIMGEKGIPLEDQRLMFNVRQLEDDKTMGHYNIIKESIDQVLQNQQYIPVKVRAAAVFPFPPPRERTRIAAQCFGRQGGGSGVTSYR